MTGLYLTGLGMTDQKQSGAIPVTSPVKGSRQERLKQALRENLKRRKAQTRGRKSDDAAPASVHDAGSDDAADRGPDGSAGGL